MFQPAFSNLSKRRSQLLIAVSVGLFIAAFFTATQPITPQMRVVSSFSVLLFALPSYLAVLKLLGASRGVALLLALGVFALALESLAIHTGFPYGNFTYTDVLGSKVLGLTPWTVAFAYPPILLLSNWIARRYYKGSFKILAITALAAMAIDLVLDPAAVRLGFWYWDKPGFFYGVPFINFLGWILSSFIGAGVIHIFWRHGSRMHSGLALSGLGIVWFWTCVNIWLGQWLPAIIGSMISLFLMRVVLRNTDTME